MMMVDPDLAHVEDERLVAQVMRRRQDEAERRQRFFQVKNRQIGLETQALDQQVAEKQAAADAEKQRDLEFAQQAAAYDQVAIMAESMKAGKAKEQAAECKHFSKQFLRKEFRREYALSDPDALKKEELPDRDNAGASSLLKFAGEDVERDKRDNKKYYEQLRRSWIAEQTEEKALREEAEREADRAYDEQVLAVTQLRGAIEMAQDETAREAKKGESDENLRLAELKKEERAYKKRQEEIWAKNHVEHTLNDPMLQETAGAGYKGVSADIKQMVYDENALQILEKKKKAEFENSQHKAYEQHLLGCNSIMSTVELHKQKLEKEKRQLLNQENEIIARAHRDMKTQLRRTYANEVGESYFSKFQTTAR